MVPPGAASHTLSLAGFILCLPSFAFSNPVFWAQGALPLIIIKLALGPLQTNTNCMSGYRAHAHWSQELLRNIEFPRSIVLLPATKMSALLIPATENVRPCTPVSRAAPTNPH